MCRIKLKPIGSIPLTFLDPNMRPRRWNQRSECRNAAGQNRMAPSLGEEIAIRVRAADMAARRGAKLLASRIVDEVRALAATSSHLHGIALRAAGIDVRLRLNLKSDPVNDGDRTGPYVDAGPAALEISAKNCLLQGIGVRCQQAGSRATQPMTIEKQIFGAHKSGVSDLDAERTAVEVNIGERYCLVVPDLRPTHPNRDRNICRPQRQSAACLRSASSRSHWL